jgi:hypothetical protein
VSPPPPELPSFSLPRPNTIRAHAAPLYGWKVTRRDRAVASGRQAGRQLVFETRHAASPMAGEGSAATGERAAEAGTEPRAEGTRRDRTRAPQRRRARRRREIAGAPDASGEGHQARRGDLAKARRSQGPVRRSRERGRAAEDGSAPVSHTDADEAEPVGHLRSEGARPQRRKGGESPNRAHRSKIAGRLTGVLPCPPSGRA